jgi:hypothetical protein
MPYKDPKSPKAIESARLSKRKFYEKNKEAYIEKAFAKKVELREYVRQKKDNPCYDCKKKYPYYVMQFDHVRGEKFKELSKLISHGSKKRIDEEIAKCELVCANCHAVRTWERNNLKSGE